MSRNLINLLGGTNPFIPLNTEPLSSGKSSSLENLYPQNNEWGENLISQKTSPESEKNDAPQTFWTSKTTDAKQLSKKLLEENFDFSKEDYEAYVKKYGELVINDEQKCSDAASGKLSGAESKTACGWATPGDVANWKTVGGKVPINLGADTIKQIQNFKRERAVDEAVKGIVDPFAREAVKTELMTLATGTGQARIDAAEKLADLDLATFNDVEAVRSSIQTIARQPLNKNNAVLQLLSAKVDLNRAVGDKQNAFSAMVNTTTGNYEKNQYYAEQTKKVADYEKQLQRAIDATGGIDANTGRRTANTTINRREAAYVNRQIGEIYRELGETGKAAERDVMVRFYEIDDRERSSPAFNIGKPRVQLDGQVFGGGYFPRSKTPEMKPAEPYLPPRIVPEAPQKKDLSEEPHKLETKQYEKHYKVVEERFDGRKTKINTQEGTIKGYKQDFQIEGSLRSEGVKTETFQESKTELGRKRPQERMITKRESATTETYQSPQLNAGGVRRAAVTAGGVNAIQEFNNWFPVVADVITNRSLNERLDKEAAAQKAFFRNNLPVPPEPKDLPKIKLRLESEHGKEKAAFLMKKLEEMSYAAWGNQ